MDQQQDLPRFLRRHIEHCPQCHDFYLNQRQVSMRLREQSPEMGEIYSHLLSEDIMENLKQKVLAGRLNRQSAWQGHKQTVLALAAVWLFALCAFLFYKFNQDTPVMIPTEQYSTVATGLSICRDTLEETGLDINTIPVYANQTLDKIITTTWDAQTEDLKTNSLPLVQYLQSSLPLNSSQIESLITSSDDSDNQ